MDTAVKFEAWREGIKRTLPREPLLIKLLVVGGGIFTLIFALTLGIYQMNQWGNVISIQNNPNVISKWNTSAIFANSTYYDIRFVNGSWENETEAKELKLTINATCDEDC